jgi:hypothetical protein
MKAHKLLMETWRGETTLEKLEIALFIRMSVRT